MAIADFVADQELFLPTIKQPEELVTELQHVTPTDVQTLARELINDSRSMLTVIGPYDDPGRFEKLLTT